MELTNGEIFQGAQALAKISQMDFPVKISYAILRIMRQIKDSADVVNETRDKLVKKYGQTDNKGQLGMKPEYPTWESFIEEYNELMGLTVNLEVYPIVLTEDGFGPDAKIDAQSLGALEKFITDKPYEPTEEKEESTDV